jgi:hypothetical protein
MQILFPGPARFINAALLLATGALLLSGCADFWRVKRPMTAASDELPRIEAPPEPPVLPPAPPPEPPAPDPPKPPPAPDTTPLPTAIPVPGKEGLVFSPYNNKLIDVKGMTPGRLVADPTYPMSERKFFRVP